MAPESQGNRGKRPVPPAFRDLRVRPKLIVLHNAFFLALAAAVYYAVVPQIEIHVQQVREREAAILGETAFDPGRSTAADSEIEERLHGSAEELEIPENVLRHLDQHPGETHWSPSVANFLYRRDPATGLYWRLRLGGDFYEQYVARAKWSLFGALGLIYALAVLALELVIMPRYVYRPIQATLEADQAALEGDREGELIADEVIPGDEIGDIMRSRNETIAMLRDKEATLERALSRLGEMAQDLRRKNEQLAGARHGMAAQDRLATIGLLSASVAHELNTPLSVLRGTVDQLLESVPNAEDRARLERASRMAQRLSRISEGLLDFSRVRGPEVRNPVSVRALIDEAWSLVTLDERAAEIEFFNEVDAEERALGDYDRLMQVFVNLLRNGVYAIDGQGVLTARSRRETDNGAEWVSIDVEDSGPGIPEDVLPNIFEAFVSTRLDSQGTGLGLTVADSIVERHGGKIAATNRSEGGARLIVTLPAAKTATMEAS